ncbi:MAG: polysaccharide biosynthesis/export family protein, partial [Candidatus Acidiferrum sp.]
GRIAEIPFDAEGINLSQALAKAGGLIDSQSDPAGVFVFRYEPEDVARALRPNSPLVQHGYSTPIVYRLDLRDPNSLFVAQSFQVLNRDLLYVSYAPITNLRKAMEIVGLITGPASSGIVACAYIATKC